MCLTWDHYRCYSCFQKHTASAHIYMFTSSLRQTHFYNHFLLHPTIISILIFLLLHTIYFFLPFFHISSTLLPLLLLSTIHFFLFTVLPFPSLYSSPLPLYLLSILHTVLTSLFLSCSPYRLPPPPSPPLSSYAPVWSELAASGKWGIWSIWKRRRGKRYDSQHLHGVHRQWWVPT